MPDLRYALSPRYNQPKKGPLSDAYLKVLSHIDAQFKERGTPGGLWWMMNKMVTTLPGGSLLRFTVLKDPMSLEHRRLLKEYAVENAPNNSPYVQAVRNASWQGGGPPSPPERRAMLGVNRARRLNANEPLYKLPLYGNAEFNLGAGKGWKPNLEMEKRLAKRMH